MPKKKAKKKRAARKTKSRSTPRRSGILMVDKAEFDTFDVKHEIAHLVKVAAALRDVAAELTVVSKNLAKCCCEVGFVARRKTSGRSRRKSR